MAKTPKLSDCKNFNHKKFWRFYFSATKPIEEKKMKSKIIERIKKYLDLDRAEVDNAPINAEVVAERTEPETPLPPTPTTEIKPKKRRRLTVDEQIQKLEKDIEKYKARKVELELKLKNLEDQETIKIVKNLTSEQKNMLLEKIESEEIKK